MPGLFATLAARCGLLRLGAAGRFGAALRGVRYDLVVVVLGHLQRMLVGNQRGVADSADDTADVGRGQPPGVGLSLLFDCQRGTTWPALGAGFPGKI